MNNIEWKEGAVCYVDNCQWLVRDDGHLVDDNGSGNLDWIERVIREQDFQLNKPRIGDYIEKSELDTEQKYNDAVEVFGLFGFKEWAGNSGFAGINTRLCIDDDGDVINGQTGAKRKLTYNQLMAIGKLKALMDEREEAKKEDGTLKPLQFKVDEHRPSSNKYERVIFDRYDDSAHVDVYDVLQAFEVTCPATQHAVKKLLCSGLRGHKDQLTDLLEAKESIIRAIELHKNK